MIDIGGAAAAIVTPRSPDPPSIVHLVAHIVGAVVRRSEVDALGSTLVEEFVRLGLRSAALWTLDEERRALVLLDHRGIVGETARDLAVLPLDAPHPLARAVRERRLVLIGDLAGDDEVGRAFRPVAPEGEPDAAAAGALFATPLVAGDRLQGLLAGVLPDPRRFTEEELHGVRAIADVTAVTLDRARVRAEERLARHTVADLDDRLRAIFDHMAHFFALLLPSGDVVDVNAAALAFMGMSREAVVGRPVWEVPWVVAQGLVETGKADVASAAAGARVVAEVPFAIPGRDGGTRQGIFEMTLSPVRDHAGEVRYLIYEARDVTDARERERQLAALRRRMQLILDATYEGVLGVDGAGDITFANRSAAALLGYAPEELVGRPVRTITRPPGSPGAAEDPIARALRDVEPGRGGDDLLRRRDGTLLPVAWHAAAIRDERERTEVAAMTFRDVTREHQLEAARRQALDDLERERLWLDAAIDQAPVGMIVVESTHGERVRLNRQARALLGDRVEIDGGVLRAPARVLRRDRAPADPHALPLARVLRGEPEASEELLVERDGVEVPVLMTATPVAEADGGGLGAVATVQDLRAQKEAERQREEWLSVIAHDLRQPLNLIIMRLGILSRGEPELPARLKNAVRHMTTGAQQLERLVGDLLDCSRIEANRLSLEVVPVDTGPFLRELADRLAPTVAGRPLRLAIDGGAPVIAADPSRLEQVLMNLISNAVKYGLAGTPIDLRAAAGPAGGLRIAVENQGRGIPPAERERLFRRFYRTAEARAGASGIGLGLYICKGIVDAHGGYIDLDSEPEGTTRFEVHLPPCPPNAP